MLSSGIFFFLFKIRILVRVSRECGDLTYLVISICRIYHYTLKYRFSLGKASGLPGSLLDLYTYVMFSHICGTSQSTI